MVCDGIAYIKMRELEITDVRERLQMLVGGIRCVCGCVCVCVCVI